jgi:formate dehydrogenase major subunit
VELRARTDASLYRGLLFMTLHFPDQVTTNFLTIHATDPKSGTAEFKASAVKVEPITMQAESEGVADASGRVTVALHEPTA